ncbi:hypothetical protein [Kutzneria sp. NPDC052558]|uniref:hypothetical protein n=1 Tax=Kutzneria sp. NPDC052558 TaxID=3364121 RepID=UPI0037CB8224
MTDLDRVTGLRPAVEDPSPDWLAATRAALLERAAEPRRRRGPKGGGLVALAAGVAVLAVIALVVPATQLLIAGPKTQYVYVKEGFSTEPNGALAIAEGWYPLDSGVPAPNPPSNTGPCQGTNGTVVACAPGAQAGSPVLGYGDQTAEPLNWSYRQFASLTTDPQQLRTWFYDLTRRKLANTGAVDDEDLNEKVFLLIGDTLKKALLPPGTVTALHQVLTMIPGAVVDQEAADASGRAGVGITRQGPTYPYRTTLVFDRTSHRFLGENNVDLKWAAYMPSFVILSSGIVDRLGDRL